MSVFEIAPHGHLSGAVAARYRPFTPVKRIHSPRGQVVAVGRDSIVLAEEGVSGHAFVGHA